MGRDTKPHIGIFGRRNNGKSSLINALTGQDTAIVSEVAGTTTDPVEKPMELLPLGPVLFIDTAGIDDVGALGELRAARTLQVFERTDLGVLVATAGEWGDYEDMILEEFVAREIPTVVVFNKIDLASPPSAHEERLRAAMRIPAVEALFPAPWTVAARRMLPSPSPQLTATAMWGPILAWSALEPLAESIDIEAPERVALDLFDRLRLREPFAQAFTTLGFEGDEGWRVAARIKVVLLAGAGIGKSEAAPAEPESLAPAEVSGRDFSRVSMSPRPTQRDEESIDPLGKLLPEGAVENSPGPGSPRTGLRPWGGGQAQRSPGSAIDKGPRVP